MNKNILNNIFATLLGVLSPIIIMPILIEAMSLEQYGDYVALISLIALINVFSDLGLGMYLPKEIAENHNDSNAVCKLIATYIAVKSCFIFISIIIIYFLVSDSIMVFLLIVYCYFSSVNLTPVLNGLEEYTFCAYIQLFVKAINIAIVISLDFSSYGIEKAIAIQCVVSFIIFFSQCIFIHSRYKFYRTRLVFDFVITTIKSSYAFFLSRLLVNIYQRSSVYIVSIFLSANLVAIYSIGFQLYQVGQAMIGAVSRVLYTSTMKTKELSPILKKTKITIASYIVLLPLIVTYGDYILGLIFSFDVGELHAISVILFLSILPLSISSYWGYPALVPFGRENKAHIGIILSSVSYYCSLAILYATSNVSLYSLVICILIADIVGMFTRLYYVRTMVRDLNLLDSNFGMKNER
jgi:O-antigen/teichoic acid export membrane protein